MFNNQNLAEEMSLCKTKEGLMKVLDQEINPMLDVPPNPPKKQEEIVIPTPESIKVELPAEKLNEIILREKEIEKKEEKIREIEDKIEKRLEQIKNPRPAKFFTKEFMQGLIAGILLAVLCGLIYLKFFI